MWVKRILHEICSPHIHSFFFVIQIWFPLFLKWVSILNVWPECYTSIDSLLKICLFPQRLHCLVWNFWEEPRSLLGLGQCIPIPVWNFKVNEVAGIILFWIFSSALLIPHSGIENEKGVPRATSLQELARGMETIVCVTEAVFILHFMLQ